MSEKKKVACEVVFASSPTSQLLLYQSLICPVTHPIHPDPQVSFVGSSWRMYVYVFVITYNTLYVLSPVSLPRMAAYERT